VERYTRRSQKPLPKGLGVRIPRWALFLSGNGRETALLPTGNRLYLFEVKAYSKGMNIFVNQAAKEDFVFMSAARAFLRNLEREEAQRQRIRKGLEEPQSDWGVWNISDRD